MQGPLSPAADIPSHQGYVREVPRADITAVVPKAPPLIGPPAMSMLPAARGKFVVTVLPGRYLSDAASFCDVRTAWPARMWLTSSASTNTQLASGVADF
jgi:hypothetical protein